MNLVKFNIFVEFNINYQNILIINIQKEGLTVPVEFRIFIDILNHQTFTSTVEIKCRINLKDI